MSRKKQLTSQGILELLIDSDSDGIPDIEIDEIDQSDDGNVSEHEEIIYHDVDVLVEEVIFMSRRT
jgi:hypothetical protein